MFHFVDVKQPELSNMTAKLQSPTSIFHGNDRDPGTGLEPRVTHRHILAHLFVVPSFLVRVVRYYTPIKQRVQPEP